VTSKKGRVFFNRMNECKLLRLTALWSWLLLSLIPEIEKQVLYILCRQSVSKMFLHYVN
jgi:hypothetical protein